MIFAYLDAGSGSLILQAVLGGIAGIVVAAKAWKARMFVRLWTLLEWPTDAVLPSRAEAIKRFPKDGISDTIQTRALGESEEKTFTRGNDAPKNGKGRRDWDVVLREHAYEHAKGAQVGCDVEGGKAELRRLADSGLPKAQDYLDGLGPAT